MPWPAWFNGSLFRPRRLPGPEQALPAASPELSAAPGSSDYGPHPLTRLIPHIPHEPAPFDGLGNVQIGAQPDRQQAVLRGLTVQTPYLLNGELVPAHAGNLESRFHPQPVPHAQQAVGLGPEGAIVVTGVR
jgi:hypothetical protein